MFPFFRSFINPQKKEQIYNEKVYQNKKQTILWLKSHQKSKGKQKR